MRINTKLFLLVRALVLGSILGVCVSVSIAASERALQWDALEKRVEAEAGQPEAELSFAVTNLSPQPVEIVEVETSCGCTAAVMARQPWIVPPGATESLRVVMDLQNRHGELAKTITVHTSVGTESLVARVYVPASPEMQRQINQTLAKADRQAVLRGDCAACHVTPAIGKTGGDLFKAACLICHGEEHRASMVPDLMQPKETRDATYWETWIRQGRENTLMPAFAKEHGGFMDNAQIRSLVEYLTQNLPSGPQANVAR